MAKKVYMVNQEYQTDIKVFITSQEYKADIKIKRKNVPRRKFA